MNDTERSPLKAPRAGTITRLVAQKKNPDRISVYLDGTYAFGVYIDLVASFELRKGLMLSVEDQHRIAEADQLLVARVKAMHYLALKARTEHEVRQKLLRQGFSDTVVESVVERLHERGYLDDEAYARSFVQGRFNNKGYGPQRIRNDLRRRGVAGALIEAALEQSMNEADTLSAARQHAEKRWEHLSRETDPRKRRKKLSDFLLRRGYTYDTVRRVAEELAGRAEDL